MGITDTAGFWDRMERVGLLAPFVRANGLRGSQVVKAFAQYDARGSVDMQDEAQAVGTWKLVLDAEKQWQKISAVEKRRILNGWREDTPHTFEEHLKTVAGYSDNSVVWALSATAGFGTQVDLFSSDQLASDIRPVRVTIRQGTTKVEALAGLRHVLAALELKWEEAIMLDGRNGLTVDKVPLAIGTMVEDKASGDGQGGVIVGGFKGKNGYLYTYLNAAGEVNSQYESGLRPSGSAADLCGANPLADRPVM